MVSDGFNEREKGFEQKFGYEEELQFKIRTQAVRMFGQWAAGQLGMSKSGAETYAENILDSEMEHSDVSELVRKVHKDFQARGKEITERILFNQFNSNLEKSRRQIVMDKVR